MRSIVTNRFINCHNILKQSGVIKSTRQFAISLKHSPQSLNDILKLKRDVTLELIRKAISLFNLNPSYLFSGIGDPFLNNNLHHEAPLIAVDHGDNERIIYVPTAAQAGYGENVLDPQYFDNLESFKIPGYNCNHGTHRCFDIIGDSMEPTFFAGQKVICSFIEPSHWSHAIKDNFVYIIITKGDIVIKRIQNKLKDAGCLELFSDNSYYDPYVIEGGEIIEIWHVRMIITPFIPNPKSSQDDISENMSDLKTQLKSQSELIQSLNNTIELMLKQNRSRS